MLFRHAELEAIKSGEIDLAFRRRERPRRTVDAATSRAHRTAPETKAAELAEQTGREPAAFKRDVRRLKELGLTESLERGYRISSHGRAVLGATTS